MFICYKNRTSEHKADGFEGVPAIQVTRRALKRRGWGAVDLNDVA